MKYLFLCFLISFSVSANTCKKVVDCVREASALTGIKYMYPATMFTDKEELSVELVMNKENADDVLSEALNLYEYMKAPTKVDNVWEIFPGRDIRYHVNLPSFEASKTVIPVLPNNHDPIQLTYHAQKGTDVQGIAMALRTLMSRYGRMIDMASGTIIVIDRASVASKILPIMQNGDVPGLKRKQPAKSTTPAKK